MVTRTRFLVLVLVAALGSTGIAVASTVGQQAVQQPAQVERVHRYYRTGPSAEYHGDAGGIGQVRPVRFEVADGAPKVAVAEASFGYRTRGAGPFVVTLRVGEVDGPQVTVRPEELRLAPAPDGAATTVRFLAPELAAGATYEAHLGVNSVFARRNTIHTRGVVLTIELS